MINLTELERMMNVVDNPNISLKQRRKYVVLDNLDLIKSRIVYLRDSDKLKFRVIAEEIGQGMTAGRAHSLYHNSKKLLDKKQ